MNIKFQRQKGFTLIELLVVVAIISLLSSVVLATLKDAREKAQISKFRQEVYQLTSALELYKSDNNKYPGQFSDFFYYLTQQSGSDGQDPSGVLNDFIPKYISKFPKPTGAGAIFFYYHNTDFRCAGETKIPEYLLIMTAGQPGFNDWPLLVEYNGDVVSGNYKCFSLK